jgi:hypothetical protein
MAVNREWLLELPHVPDRQEWSTDERRSYFARARDGLRDDLLLRSLYWTLRIGEEARQWAELEALPGYQWAQIGFLAPNADSQGDASTAGRFGLLVCCDDPTAEQRLWDRPVWVDGVSWPILVKPALYEPNVQVAGPYGGCTAGWARSRRSTYPRDGWLTASHVVPSNTTIYFSDGGTGTVVDRGGTCVDAAIVGTSSPPTMTRWLTPAYALTAGRAVELHDQSGRSVPMTIATVDATLGQAVSRHLPLRFSLDGYGQPGDSGALVDDPTNGEFAGLYLGRYVDYRSGGPPLGIALAAHYLSELMDMEVSR